MNKQDIIEEVADRTGKSPELVKEVINSLWSATRYYIQRPEECKGGIIFPGLFTISLKSHRLEKTISKDKERKNSKEFYEKLLNQNKLYERQKRKTANSERSAS